ncbi:hypothetical protein J7L00_00555 [Candidatus Bathyarchaeota archaeon]|nr:hypothetical protein [Candidatus Bathyarchaeota archaeon]
MSEVKAGNLHQIIVEGETAKIIVLELVPQLYSSFYPPKTPLGLLKMQVGR